MSGTAVCSMGRNRATSGRKRLSMSSSRRGWINPKQKHKSAKQLNLCSVQPLGSEHGNDVREETKRSVRCLPRHWAQVKNEELKGKFNKQDKKKWMCPADAARIAKERTGPEDQKHTSGGATWAVENSLGRVVDKEGGASIPSLQRGKSCSSVGTYWRSHSGFRCNVFGSLLSLPLVASPSHFLFSVLSPWSLSSSTPAPFSSSFPFLHPVKLCPSLTLVG